MHVSVLAALSSMISLASAHIPSLTEIAKMHDPVLTQIFKDSNIDLSGRKPYADDPPPVPAEGTGQGGHHYVGEVPINHPSALGSGGGGGGGGLVDGGQPTSFEGGITNLAAQGANVFYRGAQTVGQAFGIRPADYRIPLLDSAAGLIGRR